MTTARRDLISDESVGAYVGGCAERILAGNVTDLSATVAEWVERVRADPQTWEDVRAGLAAERPLVRAALSAEFAAAIRAAATTAPGEMAAFAYDHAAALVEALRVPDCGDQYHGADGGPCTGCGFDAAAPADALRASQPDRGTSDGAPGGSSRGSVALSGLQGHSAPTSNPTEPTGASDGR